MFKQSVYRQPVEFSAKYNVFEQRVWTWIHTKNACLACTFILSATTWPQPLKEILTFFGKGYRIHAS